MICKHCGSEVKDGAKFCPSCGKKTETVTPPQKKCEKCGNLLNDGVKFCPSCGTFIAQSSNAPKDETAAQEKELTCTCGNKLKPGIKFCNVCGKKVQSSDTSANASMPAAAPAPAPIPTPAPAPAPIPVPTKAEPKPEPKKEEPKPEPKKEEPNPEPKKEENKNEVPENTSAPAPADSLICSCGNKLNPGAKFCPKCGNKVGKKPAAKTEEAPNPDVLKCSCGNILNPGAKFCPKCGNKIGDTPAAPSAPSAAPSPAPASSPASSVPAAPVVPAAAGAAVKKPMNKKTLTIIGAAAAALVVIIVIIVIVANLTPKIRLADYVEVNYTGYNGYGELDYSFNSDKFRADWGGKLKYNNPAANPISYSWDLTTDPCERIISNVKYDISFSKTSGLSNGDVVKLKWNIGQSTKEALQTAIKVDLDDSETELTVADLKTVGTFDPFEGLSIKYIGYDGNGVPEIESSNYQLNYKFSKTSGLKNGDTIHVTVTAPYGDNLAKYCVDNIGSVPSTTGKDFKVNGLGDMESFDPFSDIEIEYSGYSPNGKAEIKKNGSYYLNYTLDKKEGIKNGDKITVKVTAPYGKDLEEYCKSEYSKKPSSDKKVYTVSTLPEYVTDTKEIPEETLTTMKNEGEDIIKSEITGENEKITKLDYKGIILLNLKEGKADKGTYGSERNHMFYLIYEATVETKDYDKKTISYTYWTYCKFNDIAKLSDGTYELDLNDINRPYESVSPERSSSYFKGYKSYNELEAKVITANLNDYKSVTDFGTSKQTSETSKEESKKEESKKEESSKEESSKAEESSKEETSKSGGNEEKTKLLETDYFSINMPLPTDTEIFFEKRDDSITLYDKYNYDLDKTKHTGNGWVYTIQCINHADYKESNYPKKDVLYDTAKYIIIVIYPTDVRFDGSNQKASTRYQASKNFCKDVLSTFKAKI